LKSIDFFIKEKVLYRKIQSSIASVVDVALSDVQLIDSIEEFPQKNTVKIVCHIQQFKDGFQQMVSLYYHNDSFDVESFAFDISEFLKIDCLFPSDEINPYIMLLYTPDRKKYRASMEIEKLDENIYVVESKELISV
jgi:hypothetical protein